MTNNYFSKVSFFVALLLANSAIWAESKYPAADFSPEVIYRDTSLTAKDTSAATQAAPATRPDSGSSTQNSSVTSTIKAAEPYPAVNSSKSIQTKESSMENFPIALVVLALAGFVFWSTRKPAGSESGAYAAIASHSDTSGTQAAETGVARYLKSVTPPETVATSATTGVAKYLQSQQSQVAPSAPIAAPSSPSAADTGVAKYLKSLESA